MAMTEGETYSLGDFQRWKIEPLKDYLRKRGLKVTGRNKAELVSLAFGAHTCKTKLITTADDNLKQRATQYQSLLVTEEGRLPGRLDKNWSPAVDWVCLTGSSQIRGLPFSGTRRGP